MPISANAKYSNFRITINMESSTWLSYPWIRPAATDSRFTAERMIRSWIPRLIYRFFQVPESLTTAVISSPSARKSSIRIPAVLKPVTFTRFSFGRKRQVNRIGIVSGISFRLRRMYQPQYTSRITPLTWRIGTLLNELNTYSRSTAAPHAAAGMAFFHGMLTVTGRNSFTVAAESGPITSPIPIHSISIGLEASNISMNAAPISTETIIQSTLFAYGAFFLAVHTAFMKKPYMASQSSRPAAPFSPSSFT